MLELYRQAIGSRTLQVVVTERIDGDQRPDRDSAGDDVGDPSVAVSAVAASTVRADRQRALTGHRWSMAAEEHGVGVVDVDVDLELGVDLPRAVLPAGDVLVTTQTSRALSIWAGDCAPLVLYGGDGTLVAAHAGWRGLAAGVVDVAVGELTARGDRAVVAVLGPCIHAECYEFGDEDLVAVATGVGAPVDRVARTTGDGRRCLDVPAAVAAALGRWDIGLDAVGPCTACDDRWFSHRARSDEGRHALVAWTTPTAAGTIAAGPAVA